MGSRERDPLDVAVRALRHRDRPASEIAERLARAGVDADRSAETLETLERLGYVDDGRFATARAASLAQRGWGDGGIRAQLEGAGVSAADVDAAIGALTPECDRARELVVRGGSSLRTARRLAAKGFCEEVVAEAMAENVARPGSADV